MAQLMQLRRGTDAERETVTPAEGEPIWITDEKELYIGDGSTEGGIPVRPTAAELRSGTEPLVFDSSGNARGFCATDVSLSRANAAQVASGLYAFNANGSNTASGSYASCFGNGGTASGNGGFHAGNGGTAGAGANAFHSGSAGTASGENSFHAGANGVASGNNSVVFGANAKADKLDQIAHACGPHAATGDAQRSEFPLKKEVTHSTAAWHSLVIGASAQMLIPVDSSWAFEALISGATAGCAKVFGFKIIGVVANDGGTTTIKGTPTVTTLYDADDTDFDAQAAVDDGTDALLIQVSDSTSGGDTVRWFGSVRTAEVTFPAA